MRYLALFALLLAASAGDGKPLASPIVGKTAPPLAASDVDGKKRSLADSLGRPTVLFFFCGCDWCREMAPLWGQMQQGGALPKGKDGREPVTVVAYAGDAAQTRDFAMRYSLAEGTVLLPDPKMRLALSYRAIPCPRSFVIDSRGVLRYTNDKPDEKPQKAPGSRIISRTQQALEAAAAK